MKDLRQLKVWEKTHQLTPDVYATTAGFPRHEMFGITSQNAKMQHVDRG